MVNVRVPSQATLITSFPAEYAWDPSITGLVSLDVVDGSPRHITNCTISMPPHVSDPLLSGLVTDIYVSFGVVL